MQNYQIALSKNINGKQKIFAKKGDEKHLITEIEVLASTPSHLNSSFILKSERETMVGNEIIFAVSLKDEEGSIWDPSSTQERSIEKIFEEKVKIKVRGGSGKLYHSFRRISRGQWEIEIREYKVGRLEVSVLIEGNQVSESISIELFASQPNANKCRITIDKQMMARVNEMQKLSIEMFDNYENKIKCKQEEVEIRLIGCKEDSIQFPDQQDFVVSSFTPLTRKISISLRHITWNQEKTFDLEIKEERKIRIFMDNKDKEGLMKNLFKLFVEKHFFLESQIIITKNQKNADVILIPSINRNKVHWNEIGENVLALKKTSDAQIFILKGMKIDRNKELNHIASLFLQRKVPQTILIKLDKRDKEEVEVKFTGYADVIWFEVGPDDEILSDNEENNKEFERFHDHLNKVPEVRRMEEKDDISIQEFYIKEGSESTKYNPKHDNPYLHLEEDLFSDFENKK